MIQSPIELDCLDLSTWDTPADPDKDACLSIVRVKTSWWNDNRGLHSRKDILTMKSLSKGYQILEEDAKNIGAPQVVERIVNLDECEDGLYEVIIVNEGYDWETGCLDDYDYKLVPHKP